MLWKTVRTTKTMVRTTISQNTLVRAFSIMRWLPLLLCVRWIRMCRRPVGRIVGGVVAPQSMRGASGSSMIAGPRLLENESHAQLMNASMRARVVLSNQACTPSHAAKATEPCNSWWCLPISATAAPWPIIAMMPLSWYLKAGAACRRSMRGSSWRLRRPPGGRPNRVGDTGCRRDRRRPRRRRRRTARGGHRR